MSNRLSRWILGCFLFVAVFGTQACGEVYKPLEGCETCPVLCVSNKDGSGYCVPCITDKHCRSDPNSKKICTTDFRCICGADRDCPVRQFCGGEKGCVECFKDSDCESRGESLPVCFAGQCSECDPNRTPERECESKFFCGKGIEKCASGSWSACNGKKCNSDERCDEQTAQCVPPVCKPGTTASCYEGPKGTEGKGICKAGMKVCSSDGGSYGSCPDDIRPKSQDICGNNLDDNCDGATDEGCSCYYLDKQDGVCSLAKRDNKGSCDTPPKDYSKTEICDDGLDNNCDGVVDEGCPCEKPKDPKGVCKDAMRDGKGLCKLPSTYSSTEVCDDNLDNNCNGVVDEGCRCRYKGLSQGVCGKAVRNQQGECIAPFYSAAEVCSDNLDNNCNGVINEGCPCNYNNQSRGVCAGLKRDSKGKCLKPQSYSTKEICDDNLDNNCNGVVDEFCPCKYKNLDKQPCSQAKKDTKGVCIAPVGYSTKELCDNIDNNCDGVIDEGCPCNYQNKNAGVCQGQRRQSNGQCPKPSNYNATEICDDGVDNNCDGASEEGCKCKPIGKKEACGSDIGVCSKGTRECLTTSTGTEWSVCKGEVASSSEVCGDKLDNDCDGAVDEFCPCNYLDKKGGVCGQVKRDANGVCLKPSNYSATEVCGDGVDNNCDGVVDEFCPCNYLNKNHPVCSQAKRDAKGVCVAPVKYSTKEACDNIDNNCDGVVDEGCRCNYNKTSVGVCANGTIDTQSLCQPPSTYSITEVCGDGLDNNCNDAVDEFCSCNYLNKNTPVCNQAKRDAKGVCQKPVGYSSSEVCIDGLDNDCDGFVDYQCPCNYLNKKEGFCGTATIGKDGRCQRPPSHNVQEQCGDGVDNNCNGVVDEGCPCNYKGKNAGVCRKGILDNNGKCLKPSHFSDTEVCDGLDNNCDGAVDEGISKSCYSGPQGTENVGVCKAGKSFCTNGAWGPCTNDVKPQSSEVCDGKDNDCNNQVDDNVTNCVCKNGKCQANYLVFDNGEQTVNGNAGQSGKACSTWGGWKYINTSGTCTYNNSLSKSGSSSLYTQASSKKDVHLEYVFPRKNTATLDLWLYVPQKCHNMYFGLLTSANDYAVMGELTAHPGKLAYSVTKATSTASTSCDNLTYKKWTNVQLYFDKGSLEFYVNGNKKCTAGVSWTSVDRIWIRAEGCEVYWDDIRVW